MTYAETLESHRFRIDSNVEKCHSLMKNLLNHHFNHKESQSNSENDDENEAFEAV